MSKFADLVVVSSTIAFLGSGGYTVLPKSVPLVVRERVDPSCNVQGNISIILASASTM